MLASRKKALCAAGAAGIALAMIALPASADYAPQAGDVVGVGSDTLQNLVNFADDGSPVGDSGYNNIGNVNRVVSIDATADANDGAVYNNTGGPSGGLPVGVVLRAGKSPVQRPNGSGAGRTALESTSIGSQINFARSSSYPSNTEVVGNKLHVVKIATDDIVMAVPTGSSHTTASITPQQLVGIYNCSITDWGTLLTGTANGVTINPVTPQTGSGTGATFLADLKLINSSATINLDTSAGGCVHQVEENDPTAYAGSGNVNRIGPFSSGRKKLYDSGYFHDVTAANGTGGALSSNITLLYGNNTANACLQPTSTTNTTSTYCHTRGLYIVFKQAAVTSTTKFQPGGTTNWVQELFLSANPTTTAPYFGTTTDGTTQIGGGVASIADGGVTPNYKDCGGSDGTTTTYLTSC